LSLPTAQEDTNEIETGIAERNVHQFLSVMQKRQLRAITESLSVSCLFPRETSSLNLNMRGSIALISAHFLFCEDSLMSE
jgi:hypothetical protein